MLATIVIPAIEAGASIAETIAEIYAVVPSGHLGEVIVVDDASIDQTAEVVKSLISGGIYTSLSYLSHTARCGLGSAIHSGVIAASFDVIAIVDGDGRSDPIDVARLIERLARPGAPGPALVCGVRTRRKQGVIGQVWSRAGNAFKRAILRDHCPDATCAIKIGWREALLAVPYFANSQWYLPALFLSHGHDVVHVPVNDRLRATEQPGASSFGMMGPYIRPSLGPSVWFGIWDIMGVFWLQYRTKIPQLSEQWPNAGLDVARRSRSSVTLQRTRRPQT